MNIYEIIKEATPPSSIIIPPGSTTAAPLPPPPSPANSGPQISTARRKVRVVSVPAQKAIDRAFASRLGKDKILLRGKQVDIGSLGNVGKMTVVTVNLVKYLSLMPFVFGYFGKLAILDDMVAQGELSQEDLGPAKRMVAEQLAVNIVAAGAVLKLVKAIGLILRGGRTALALVGLLSAVPTGGATLGPTLAGFAASSIAITAINAWLQSEDGQEAVTFLIMTLIDPMVVGAYNLTAGQFVDKLKSLSPAGQAATQKALSSSPTLAGTLAGKPEVSQGAGQNQGAKPDNSNQAKEPFGASGYSTGWGTSDPYKDLPSLPDVKLKR
jgi:hypothetical protein